MPDGIRDMTVRTTSIDGLVVIGLKEVDEPRGTVREFFRGTSASEGGLSVTGPWAQINVTETRRGAVRGLHGEAMNKLVGIVAGEAFGAYVDLRADSPSYRRVETVALRPGVQVLVPNGVCNGFQALTDCQYLYCFDQEWQPGMPGVGVHALDPTLAIAWPLGIDVDDPAVFSERDRNLPPLP